VLGLAFLQFTWLNVLILCFSHMNYVDDFVTFLVNYILGSAVSPEERSSFFRNAVHFWVFSMKMEIFLQMMLILFRYRTL